MIDKRSARAGGMPLYKWLGNRLLTRFQNWMLERASPNFIPATGVYSTKALAAGSV